jgi:hypothetical protein
MEFLRKHFRFLKAAGFGNPLYRRGINCLYRESSAAVRPRKQIAASPLAKLAGTLLLLLYFILLPILIFFAVNWCVYAFTANNFYRDAWMMPVLLLFSTFLSGAFIRQKMEDEHGRMGLFFLGILALAVFAWLTQLDIDRLGSVYSHFFPKRLPTRLEDYTLMLPAVGMLGMLCYKQLTLKHYQ